VKKITAIFVFVLEAWKLELNRKSKRKVLNYIELATITIGSVRTPQVPEGYIIFRVYFYSNIIDANCLLFQKCYAVKCQPLNMRGVPVGTPH
jgi:hypothetical protein